MYKTHITITMMLALLPYLTHAQDASHNYVKTEIMQDENGSNAVQSIQYYNGLGYPTVAVSTIGTEGQTAGTLTTYDAMGREKRIYLPVPCNNLDYMPESEFYYKSYYYQDSGAFTQNHYDALDRLTAVDIAGNAWRNEGKQNRTKYRANDLADNVLHYEASDNYSHGLIQPSATSCRYYPAGSLRKVVSYDADDKSTTVFTDKNGRKILERTAAGDTYYVYNNLDQLRFVLTPGYAENSNANTIYAYEYRYDYRGRVAEKILPGSIDGGVSVKYWYDKADRVAYMKDAALGSRYRFYLYDKLGRLCVQGTCSDGVRNSGNAATTSYQANSGGICGTGYTAPYTISSPQLEIVNYYDNYSYLLGTQTARMPVVIITNNQRRYAKGFLTGTLAYASNGGALGTVCLYDQKGQVVRTVRKSLNGHVEDVNTEYTFTGDIDNTEAKVNVGYGVNFIALTDYAYQYGKKTSMSLSVSHGNTPLTRATSYSYDFLGRLGRKSRQLWNSSRSLCTYSYDLHGWPTSIYSGGFTENLYYADGLARGYYNGNISTIKWRTNADIEYNGYNLEYDASNRLCDANFGSGDNLSSNRNFFDENVKYDANGNITRLQRRGLADNMHGGFGLVDNLYMTYNGNQLVSVRDNAPQLTYTGATDFNGVQNQEYPLTYNDAGALLSDAGRNIAKIDYDNFSNPVRIQFTNGNVTRYVYSATGEKLRVIYQTAVPNISVAIGSTRELTRSEILYTDSIDYFLNGALTLKNGRIDKYQFDEGYCQAKRSNYLKDNFTFCYYDKDHLGNIRQVTEDDNSNTGLVTQIVNYYPFGMQFCAGPTTNNVQSHKYNGKEFDSMHGLNTYDYGARQYNPVTARWDRMDPLAHKYYSVSPYVYCMNNPERFVDIKGLEPGDFFKTIDQAAIDFGLLYNGISILQNREYMTVAYAIKNKNGEKGFTYSEPVRGEKDRVNIAYKPKGKNVEAYMHTHGAYDKSKNNNDFSGTLDKNDPTISRKNDPEYLRSVQSTGTDIAGYNEKKTLGYVGTPNGQMQKYDPKTGKISVVSNKLPSDPNDSSRVNNITPHNDNIFIKFINFILGK